MWEFIWRWETLWTLLLVLYVPSCIGLIVIVLLQKGKGTGFAGAFGIGAGSDTVFGPRGSRSLPAKLTTAMAIVFMTLALVMSLISGRVGKGVAPEKVESGDELGAFGPVAYDDLLDDLGSAVTGAETATTEGTAPAEEPAQDAPAADVSPEQPESPPVAESPGEITVTVPLETAPGEEPASPETPAAPEDPS